MLEILRLTGQPTVLIFALAKHDSRRSVGRGHAGKTYPLRDLTGFLHLDIVRHDKVCHHALQLGRCEEASRANRRLLQGHH